MSYSPRVQQDLTKLKLRFAPADLGLLFHVAVIRIQRRKARICPNVRLIASAVRNGLYAPDRQGLSS
ncbi:hypothetical protein [Shimia sp. NS0008-38b]|uniref:hypothetical protein n=1 Tax=Shimia sp. NS0008-38b TaxID=3127653 RepID=UPI00333EDE2F